MAHACRGVPETGQQTGASDTTTSGVSTVGACARSGRTGARTGACSGQPADYRDDELELVDVYDPEIDLLDDLDDWDED